LSQRPHRMRTWARKGQTPVLEFNFNWKLLSVIAGMTFWNFYFQLFPKAIRSAQVIEFLGHLKRHLRGPLLVIWDRLPAHRSRATQEWVREQGGWIHTEYLPAYAPELNPVEYLWGYWKQHELPNVCPKDWWELHERSASHSASHPPSPPDHRGLLGAVQTPLRSALYYVILNKLRIAVR